MYASFQAFQTALGFGVCSRAAVEGNVGGQSELAVAWWSCGCGACGIDEACMMHLPCQHHVSLWTSEPEREQLRPAARAERSAASLPTPAYEDIT